jgi:hypothetical protein
MSSIYIIKVVTEHNFAGKRECKTHFAEDARTIKIHKIHKTTSTKPIQVDWMDALCKRGRRKKTHTI